MIFCDYEKDIYNNVLDVEFFNCYYRKLCFQLNQLFYEKKDVICCFLHHEFEYKGRDPRSGTLVVSSCQKKSSSLKRLKLIN